MLRISSGQLKGRRILAPEGGLKPTSDKVRQALFNALRPIINGSRFLDLFAGSGSVGVTALSEGASFAAFVEQDPRTYRALRQNCMDLPLEKNSFLLFKADACKMETLFTQPFDIIFADPFYPHITQNFAHSLHEQAYALLDEEGLFIFEHSSRTPKEILSQLKGFKETKKYGDTSLSFFQK